jgi:hypothetical protein
MSLSLQHNQRLPYGSATWPPARRRKRFLDGPDLSQTQGVCGVHWCVCVCRCVQTVRTYME